MRNFLPIKGPGGRNLTGKEKVALLTLVITLLLCVLTLVAGDNAYLMSDAPNPIFSIVSAFGSALGGGIVALYALIMVWSALIYLKGERVADITPLVGRCAAAFAVTIGVSGVLGIAHLDAAGGLGDLVGRSLGNTFGAGAGFPILILLMLLGAHLASQGAWTALREPMIPAVAVSSPGLAPVGYGFGLQEAPESRLQDGPPMPDDGDPTADERSLAVQKAMEEIERSQGVTIVDVEPTEAAEEEHAEAEAVDDETRSIGEEVDDAPEPAANTEEAEVQRGLAAVKHALEVTRSAHTEHLEDGDVEEAEAEEVEGERYESPRHGLVPVPGGEENVDEEDEVEEEEEDEFAEVEQYEEDDDDYETAEDEDEEEEEEEDEGEYAEDDEDFEEDEVLEEEEDEEDEYEEEEDEEDDEDEEEDEGEYAEDEEEEDEPEQLELFTDEDTEEATTDELENEEEEEDEDEELDEQEAEEDDAVEAAEPEPEPAEDDGDPYAQGGLLRRLQARGPQSQPGEERPHSAFDWRGRPVK